MPLQPFLHSEFIEVGTDEAGRGCLAGPVFAAAVILPQSFHLAKLNDSKQLSKSIRYDLRKAIEDQAIEFAIAHCSPEEIDTHNILWASVKAMHKALSMLKTSFNFILVDGNRFKPYKEIHYQTIVKGDAKFASIAAASILAKTYRDDFMFQLHEEFPQYHWNKNAGYPTPFHRKAIEMHGITPHHRKSFHLLKLQQTLF